MSTNTNNFVRAIVGIFNFKSLCELFHYPKIELCI